MDKLDLIAALADCAAILRESRRAGLRAPLVCLGSHAEPRFVRWGPGLMCCACGRAPLPAAQLHAGIVRMLRARMQTSERRAA